jgi:hypothetical protein
MKAGFVDPLKVVMAALLDARRVASLLALSEARMAEASEEDEPSGDMDIMDGFQSIGWSASGGFRKLSFCRLIYYPLNSCIPYSSPLLILI